MTKEEAFELGDSDDRERAVRAAALLLDWTMQQDMAANKLTTVARGISDVLYAVAKDISWEKIRRGQGEEPAGKEVF